jgi:heme-degrading monooxygenase HmoA
MPADTPEPPYYAVIFTTTRAETDDGYAAMAQHMGDLAATQPGYLGIESARTDIGITVSYWSDEASIAAWKANVDHSAARDLGRSVFYSSYVLRVARVERDYCWPLPAD